MNEAGMVALGILGLGALGLGIYLATQPSAAAAAPLPPVPAGTPPPPATVTAPTASNTPPQIVTVPPMASTVAVPSGGTLVISPPAGFGLTSVTSATTGGPASIPINSGICTIPNVAEVLNLTLVWTDTTGASQTSTMTVTPQ